jgi:hypothetical protein
MTAPSGDLGSSASAPRTVIVDISVHNDLASPPEEEPDDHLAVECDFVSYLLLKDVYALAAGLSASADVARDARASFLSDHAAVVGRRFSGRRAVTPDASGQDDDHRGCCSSAARGMIAE